MHDPLLTAKRHLSRRRLILGVSIVAVIEAVVIIFARAAGPFVTVQSENGTLAGKAVQVTDAAAAGGKAVQFNVPITGKPKVMVLGDSISAGNTDEVVNGYRLDLLNRMPGYSIDYVGSWVWGDDRLADQDMQAEGGACINSSPCYSSIMYPLTAGWITAAQPNVVIMNGGSNDYCCGHENRPDSEVIQLMTDWINLIWATKPDVYIIVIGMPNDHDGYKNWIPTYVQQQAALGKHIYYVSMDGVDTYDSVHPNIPGYQTLADRIAPILMPILDTLQ